LHGVAYLVSGLTAVGGADVSAERMGLIVRLVDPWNLLWVMPAKGNGVTTHALLSNSTKPPKLSCHCEPFGFAQDKLREEFFD